MYIYMCVYVYSREYVIRVLVFSFKRACNETGVPGQHQQSDRFCAPQQHTTTKRRSQF